MTFTVDSSGITEHVSVQKIRYSGNDQFVVSAFLTKPKKTGGQHPLVVFGHWGEGDKSEFLEEAICCHRKVSSAYCPMALWFAPVLPLPLLSGKDSKCTANM